MYLAKYLVDSYQVDPKITDIMDNMEIVMVPFVNPDGYAVSVYVVLNLGCPPQAVRIFCVGILTYVRVTLACKGYYRYRV